MSAVNVRVKEYALFFNSAKLCKRENLKTAAVGKYRTVPACEEMNTAELFYKPVTRSDVQMISVAKLNLTADFF